MAMLLAAQIADFQTTVLAIDIGTNTEICLNHNGRMTSVSCASGPAFEGAHIKYGMRAAPGSIEHVRLSGDRLDIQTIGGEPPVGICGSGLLDVVAQLRLNNVLDVTGRMAPHPRVRNRDGQMEFVLVERPGKDAITVSQKDVRELQLAKAAIRLGIRALAEAAGLTEDQIETSSSPEPSERLSTWRAPQRSACCLRCRWSVSSRSAMLQGRERVWRSSPTASARWPGRLPRAYGYIELASIPDFSRKYAEASPMSGRD